MVELDHRRANRNWLDLVCALLLILPWVEPWAPAPLPNVVPLLVSWACIGLLMVLGHTLRPLDMARAWAIAAGVSSIIGLLQYFGQADWLSPWVHVPDHLGEAMANLRQRNQLATLTAIGIAAVLWWDQNGLKRTHAWWMLALLTMGNAATNSRTGLLHMLVVTSLVMVWSRLGRPEQDRLSWRLALAGCGLYAMAIWALPQWLSMTAGLDSLNAVTRLGNNDGCGSRKVLWHNVLELIAQKPWWGWGVNELKYAHYSATYPGERFCDILGNAHNGLLQMAFVLGVPIAGSITLGLATLTWALRPWKSRPLHHQMAWAVLAVIALHSLLEFPLWYGPFQMATLLSIVLLVPHGLQALALNRQYMRIAGSIILAVAAFIAVDYSRVRPIFIPASQRWSIWPGDAMTSAKQSMLFQTTAEFGEFSLTPVTPENAAHMLKSGEALLHYSPEPQVIRKVITAAKLTGDNETAQRHQMLMDKAFPAAPGSLKVGP